MIKGRSVQPKEKKGSKWGIEIDAVSTAAPERCTKPSVRTVDKNVKCHLSPRRAGRSTVKSAGKSIDRQEENIDDISKLGIRSDAHSRLHLHYLALGVAHARRGGATVKDVVKTRNVTELIQFIKK